MAMAVKQHGSIQKGRLITGHLMLQEFTQEERLASQPIGTRVRWKQVSQLVAKHRSAARLQHDDGPSSVEVRAEHAQDPLKVFLCLAEHAEIVERPSTAGV